MFIFKRNKNKGDFFRRHKKKIIILSLLLVAIIIAIIILSTLLQQDDQNVRTSSANQYMEETVVRSDIVVGVTEMGSAGLIATSISFDFRTTVLEVEAKPGEYVNAGDALLKIDAEELDDMISDAKDALYEARLKLESEEISYNTQKLQAAQNYAQDLANGDHAVNVYNLSIAELETEYNSLLLEISSLESQKSTLQAEVTANAPIITTLNTELSALELSLKTETDNYNLIVGPTQADTDAYNTIKDSLEKQIETKEGEIEQAQQPTEQLSQVSTSLTQKYYDRESYVVSMELKKIDYQQDYDTDIMNYNSAQQQYDNTMATLEYNLKTAQSNVSDLVEELEQLEDISIDGTIVSPIDGYVMTVADEGAEVNSGTAVVSIANKANVDVFVSIPQEDIADISIGMAVNIRFDAYEDILIKAVVDSISITPASGMQSSVNYTVGIVCDLSSYQDVVIYQGMTADVTFVEKQVEDVLIVSNKCITLVDGKQYVDVMTSDGKIETVEVKTGFSDGFDVEITYGLSEGDTVLIENAVMQNVN